MRHIQDPIATQLPLAFALEPSLLPLAVANGFHMDSKVCLRSAFRSMLTFALVSRFYIPKDV